MLKDFNNRQTVETMSQERPEVTLAAEGNTDSFKVGDELRLSQNNGKFCLVDENEHIIDAQICANVPLEEALTLSLVKAAFSVVKIAGNAFKAEMKMPVSLVHKGKNEWCYLY